jgi:hypothetical protein
MKRSPQYVHFLLAGALCIGLTGCGGNSNPSAANSTPTTPVYTIGGTVSGLASGTSVTLSNTSNKDVVAVALNGSFTFPTPLAAGGAWNVIVSAQPTNQTCAATNYQGSVTNGNVTNINVTCSTNTYALTATASGLASGQSLTVLVNGNPLTARVTNSGTFSLGSITAGSSYAVTLNSGWYATSLTSGTYCYVQNGSGTASADVNNISIVCGAPPSQINLATDLTTATQNGVSYAGWSLINPKIVNGNLFYEVFSGTTTLSMTMSKLETLFDGSSSSQMGADGDPSTPQENVGNCTATCASNVTALQTNGMGVVTVAVPTLAQLTNIFGASPSWDGSNYFWSSTITTDASPAYINGHYALQLNGNTLLSDSVSDGTYNNLVAFQVQ